jgi:DNA sulfur modification protein DndB
MLENISPAGDLRALARSRQLSQQRKSVHPKLVAEAESQGWQVMKPGKTSVRVQRPKPLSQDFEDRVWTLVYRMQFEFLSGAGGAKLVLDPRSAPNVKNQIDVFGVDSELVLAIECKTAERFNKRPQFQEELAKFSAFRERISRTSATQWPVSHKRHTVLIYFVCNINLTDNDRERAKQSNVLLFDEKDLDYYEKLLAHLGPAAKYQFFADMLPGKQIAGLEIKVPAVRTKMGSYYCYTFPISPEYLLKISYVSHRSKGKASDIHTYQRMISRSRLRQIREYISEQGIFPTNIVVNLDKKCVDFQRARQENTSEEANASGTLGWLQIKAAYKSAWIIDGQHRLFAYSGHPRAKSGHLAVLAFEGIPPSAQARLFVDINAKQKSVKPSLLQELFAELHWDAEAPAIRIQAIVSKAIQIMDADKDSPLAGRIQTADATKDFTRCISLATLFKAVERSDFYIARETKAGLIDWGPLWAVSNDATLKRTTTLLKGWFVQIKEGAPDWWELGSDEGGGLSMNDSIAAFILTLRSVFAHLQSTGRNLLDLTDVELVHAVAPYAKVIAAYVGSLSPEERKRYRELRGTQGQTTRSRRFQQAIRTKYPTFNPTGLDDFIASEKEQTNLKAKQVIDRIEVLLKKIIVEELKQEYATDETAWWQEGVPKNVRLEVAKRRENDDNKRGSNEAYFDLIDYRTIALANWTLFKNLVGYGKKNDSKEKQTKWMQEVNEWRNQVAHASSGVILKVDALQQLEQYMTWLHAKANSSDLSEEGDLSDENLEASAQASQ